MGGDVKMEFVAQLVNAMWSFVLADLKLWGRPKELTHSDDRDSDFLSLGGHHVDYGSATFKPV